jgi:hypothetical protein
MFDIGVFVTFVFNFDRRRAGSAHPGAADLAGAKRVEQNHEPAKVLRMLGDNSFQCDLILEFAQVRLRRDDLPLSPCWVDNSDPSARLSP